MFPQIRTIAHYTLLEALRNRLVWLLLLVALAGVGFSGFLEELALTEKREIQLVVLASFLRVASVLLLSTFVVTSMVREINDKGLELALALPLSRSAYLFGKMAGFFGLASLLATTFGLITALLAPTLQSVLWSVSLILECWIVIAFSMLCVLSFNQVMQALSASAAFYLLTRSITTLQFIGTQSAHLNKLDQPQSVSQQIIHFMVECLSAVLPHLDNFTRTDWLVYASGSWQTLWPIVGQSVIYLTLLSGAALVDFYRKNI